jgi:quercetin dioxygenase-like cupin family protein
MEASMIHTDPSRVVLRCAAVALLLATMLATNQPLADEPPIRVAPDDADLDWGPCPEFMPDGCALAIVQGDPAQPNADVFFRLPGESQAPHHWHTSAERMVLLSGELHVEFDGHPLVVMRPGTYAYGPAGLPHTAACESSEPCVLFIAFEEPVDAIATGAR